MTFGFLIRACKGAVRSDVAVIFSGQFKYTVDSKGRINIPAPFRSQLPDKSAEDEGGTDGIFFHVTFGVDPCLYAFPRSVFKEEVSKLEEECGSFFAPKDKIKLFRRIMSNAQPCRSDQQGRIIIPKEHLEYAQIQEEVLIIGLGSRIELWNPELFKESIDGDPEPPGSE